MNVTELNGKLNFQTFYRRRTRVQKDVFNRPVLQVATSLMSISNFFFVSQLNHTLQCNEFAFVKQSRVEILEKNNEYFDIRFSLDSRAASTETDLCFTLLHLFQQSI